MRFLPIETATESVMLLVDIIHNAFCSIVEVFIENRFIDC